MADKEEQMAAANRGTSKAAADLSTVETPPKRAGDEYRQEWADANGVDPLEMREIHAIGGWIDRFDGAGWVRE